MKSKKFYKKILSLFLIAGITPVIVTGLATAVLMNKMTERKLIQESEKTISESLSAIGCTLDAYIDAIERLEATRIPAGILRDGFPSDLSSKRFYEKVYTVTASLASSLSPPAQGGQTDVLDISVSTRAAGNVHLISIKDRYILSLQDTPDVYDIAKNSNWGFYRKARESEQAIIYPNRYKNSYHTQMAATAIKAIRLDGRLAGYLAIDIPMDILKSRITGSEDLLPIHFSLIAAPNYILWDDNHLASSTNFARLPQEIYESARGHIIETSNGYRDLMAFAYSGKYRLILLGKFNLELILGNLNVILYVMAAAIAVTVCVCVLFSLLISKKINTPLQTIVASMEEMENGNFDVRANLPQQDEFAYLARQFNIMCRNIKELFQKDREKQELLRIAEIRNLHSQINPHFLYNTLDSIKYLAKMNGEEQIFIMVKSLCFLLKNGFNAAKEFTTVGESLKNLASYIAIQKIRFADKFETEIDVDPQLLSYPIPNLILQPIVENSMLHGLEPLPGLGKLTVRGYHTQELLFLSVEDNGVGMTKKRCAQLRASLESDSESSHIGLKNIHQRIRLYYGSGFGLSIESELGRGATVTLKLPFSEEVSP